MPLPTALSHRLAAAMQVLIAREDFDLDTQWGMYDVLRTTDAQELTDYPRWITDLVVSAESRPIDRQLPKW